MSSPKVIEQSVYFDGNKLVFSAVVENLGQNTPPNPAAAEIVVVEGHLFGNLDIINRYPSKYEWYSNRQANLTR